MQSDTHLRRMPAKEFIHRYLQHDGVLILRLLAYNSSDLVVTELIQQLWQFYKRVGSGPGSGGPGSTTGSAVSSAAIPSSSRGGGGGGRQVSVRLLEAGNGRDEMWTTECTWYFVQSRVSFSTRFIFRSSVFVTRMHGSQFNERELYLIKEKRKKRNPARETRFPKINASIHLHLSVSHMSCAFCQCSMGFAPATVADASCVAAFPLAAKVTENEDRSRRLDTSERDNCHIRRVHWCPPR